MLRRSSSLLAIAAALVACAGEPTTVHMPLGESPGNLGSAGPWQAVGPAAPDGSGLTRRTIPGEDPGPPIYARVSSILDQFFHHDGLLAILFYRPPDCVPAEFNLLLLFHPPTGPEAPGAFGCPLLTSGFLLIEGDAPLGTFPRQAVMSGSAVPIWFVDWATFRDAAADGVVTLDELRAMEPLRGTAHRFRETLMPRPGEHKVILDAAGTLEDGRSFQLHVTHLEDRTRAIRIRLR